MELIADGTDPTLVQSMLENQLAQLEAKINGAAKVWESAGRFFLQQSVSLEQFLG
ncbi:MAG: hypothetical protein L6V95_11455 [Candidatus Melainabacteria bacterium]|nr:MAG: hypothetical protein L6V95_11455 [Candidatus Melainabacteria bacterium]